ncbi:glycosyltransferase [Sulfitobacter sp. 1A12126]|uniref:glycosyltransferase n=1 Tax=Sulfitobacter sp. 1A12126 TaxID=3368591 RepID=UPI003744F676
MSTNRDLTDARNPVASYSNGRRLLTIVHVIETLSVEGGGADRVTFELARAQAERGHKVRILCFNYCNRPQILESPALEVIRLNDPGPIRRFFGLSREFTKALSAAISDCDILHVHGVWRYFQTQCRRVSAENGVPYVYQPHGSFERYRMRHKSLKKKIWLETFERKNVRSAASVIVESERDRRGLRGVFPECRTDILPNSGKISEKRLSSAEFSSRYPGLKAGGYYLFLGRIDFHKGLDILVRAFSRLDPETRPSLAIVGPNHNNTLTSINDMVRQLGLNDVYFFDMTNGDKEKATLLSNSRCFILPSYSENFGLTVLEAMLAETPVIVSRETAWEHLEQKRAGFVIQPTEDDLFAAIQRYEALSSSARIRIVAQAKEIAMEYSWEAIVERADEIYSAAIDQRTRLS